MNTIFIVTVTQDFVVFHIFEFSEFCPLF